MSASMISLRMSSLTRPTCVRLSPSRVCITPFTSVAPELRRMPLGATSARLIATSAASSDMTSMLTTKNAENPVMVYSKTYCPYCADVKQLFKRLGVSAKVVELDELADGAAVQDALRTLTGRNTVPQVFVGGELVGGCDDTNAAYSNGSLAKMLSAAGISI